MFFSRAPRSDLLPLSRRYNVNHSAIDSDLCEILKSIIKKYIEMTDYPSLPTYSRFFGKVECLQFNRRAPIRRTKFASTDSATSQFARNTGTTTPIRNASSTSQVSSNTETTLRGENNTN